MTVAAADIPEPRKPNDVELLAVTSPDDSPLDAHKYLAVLSCGCGVSGTTRAKNVRLGAHGAYCEEHKDFFVFEDFVSTRPLVV